MADRSDGNGKRSMPADPARSEEESPSPDRVEAVSARLIEKKFLLDRPSTSAKLDLSEVSRWIGDALRTSKDVPPSTLGLETRSLSLDPSRIDLPEGKPNQDELRQDQQVASAASTDGQFSPTAPAISGSTPTSRAISTASRLDVAPATTPLPGQVIEGIASGRASVPKSTGSIEGRPESTSRIMGTTPNVPSIAIPVGGGRLGHALADNLGTSTGPGAADGPASQPGSTRTGGVQQVEGQGGPGVSGKVGAVAALDRLQDVGGMRPTPGSRTIDGLQVPASGTTTPGIMAGSRSDSSNRSESSMNFVRNPLSSDLKNFSMADPAESSLGGGSSSPGGGGLGPGDPPAGGSGSPQGGAPVDLTKTNELLQQLLEAVRNQRGSPLPAGGQTVYSDR